MNKNHSIIIILVFSIQIVFGQLYPKKSFYLNGNNSTLLSEEDGLRSNIINCIALQGEKTTWIGTGLGISVMHDSVSIFSLDTMRIINDKPRFIFDSIPSLSVQDSLVAFASMTNQDGDPTGTGIYITENGLIDQISWHFYPQPIDSTGDSLAIFGSGYFIARPLVGTRGVVSYSMDYQDNYLWITSWYGGLRRFNLTTNEWNRIPLPLDDEETLTTCDPDRYINLYDKLILKDYYWDSSDPYGNNNHKTFSVLAYGDTVWIGTANGINRGILGNENCVDWQHYFHPNDNLSGNWVLSIAKQEYNNKRIIWAVTVNAILPTEQMSVSFTQNDGETWEIVDELTGIRCHDISVDGSIVYVASDVGLWKSADGTNWKLIPPAVEATPISSNEILSNTVYAVAADNRAYFNKSLIWIGTPDGLARSYNLSGENWQIYRAEYDKDQVYAYPNPFSPFSHNQLNDDGWVRFHLGDFGVQQVNMKIYNFAFETVYSEKFDWKRNPGAMKWNGRDENDILVSNGVYFVNLEFAENENSDKEAHWLKLVVVK